MKTALTFCLAAALAAAAAPELDISSSVDKSEITIGDRISYEIKVIYPAGARVELPSVLGNLGTFEVKDYQVSEPKPAGKAGVLQTWRFNLSTFTVGKYVIPPQQVILRTQDSAVFFTQPIEINVARTSPETVKDIADIAGIAEVEKGLPWLAFVLGALLAAALGIFTWRLKKRRGPREAEKPRLPPFEEALEQMKGLRPAEWVRQNRAREYCFAVSEVLRRYVTRRYEIDALEATTTEFLERARPLPLTSAHKQWLAGFCEATDLIKFASGTMLESDAEQWHGQVLEFLRQTKPRAEDQAVSSGSKAPGGPAQPAKAGQGKGGVGPKGAAAPRIAGSGVIETKSPDAGEEDAK